MNHDEPPWYDLVLRPWHVLEIGRSRFWWQWWCQLLGFAWPCRWKWCATSQWWLKLAMRKQEKFVPLGLPQSWHILTFHDTMSTCNALVHCYHLLLFNDWSWIAVVLQVRAMLRCPEVTATELIKTVTAFNGQKAELETFNGHVDEASSTAIQTSSQTSWVLQSDHSCSQAVA